MMEFMGFWPETEAAWKALPEVDGQDLFEHFGLVRQQFVPVDFNFVPAFEEKILEQTDTHILMVDATGCTKRIEKKEHCSSMPHFIDFPIKDRADFEAVKERLNGKDYGNRYPKDWRMRVAEYADRDYTLGAIIRGPFAFCRDFVHFEQLMMMAYDDPTLIQEMMAFQATFIIHLWEKLLNDVSLDFVYVGEDMAYKTGPMFSPSMLRAWLKPLYMELTSFFKAAGVQTIILDSDGDVRSLLDLFVESGITCILPLERAAGMDPTEIRQRYPRLQMIGGIDKQAIAQGRDGIRQEMHKVRSIVGQSGWIPCFDHSVPPIVSYQDYRDYLNCLRETLNGAIIV